jgi:hypothetical protein
MRTCLSLCLALIFILSAAGCAAPVAVNDAAAMAPTSISTALPPTLAPSATDQPTATLAPSATLAPTQTPTLPPTAVPSPTVAVYGPGNYPPNINPLSGLPVSDPSALALPPAMISISNFPITARPQSGLSTTPFVYEVYVGDGMTRFLATVYGDLSALNGQSAEFGPIRSGRLPYEPLRMLMGGFMLIASGDETVLSELKLFTNVWNPASNDVNGVTVTGKVVENVAKQFQAVTGKPVLDGLVFDPRAPLGGKAAKQLWVPYSGANNVIWKYNPTSGGYARYQDNYDGLTYTQVIDKQTGQALDYKNVIVLFAIHHAIQAEKIDIGLAFVKQAPALLLRDGKMYDIFWSSQDAEYYQKTGKLRIMRYLDADGSPVPLKPGQTWVEVVTSGSPVFETADSMAYSDLYNKKVPGSGAWGVQFLQPIPDK